MKRTCFPDVKRLMLILLFIGLFAIHGQEESMHPHAHMVMEQSKYANVNKNI